jgi:hypothetical protein
MHARSTLTTFALVAFAGLALAGCGGDSHGGSVGDGGFPFGSGGSSGGGNPFGSGGSSGGGDPFGSGCNFPSCYSELVNLTAQCQPSGTCMEQVQGSAPSVTVNACWSNGVKTGGTFSGTAGGPVTGTFRVTKPDGRSPCFSFDLALNQDKTLHVTYKNASGFAVGSITINADRSATISCSNGASATLPASCGMSSSSMPGMTSSSKCTDGFCTL